MKILYKYINGIEERLKHIGLHRSQYECSFRLLRNRLAILSLLTLPIFISIIYIIRYAVNVPYWDEWDLQTELIRKLYEGNLSFMDFFRQHNESRPFFPRFILLVIDSITRYNMRYEAIATFLLYCVSSFIIVFMYRHENKLNAVNILALVPVSWFYFNLSQMRNMLFGMFLLNALMFIGFLSAVNTIDKSKGLDRNFGFSLMAAVISTFSFSAGLTVWPVCLVQLILQKSKAKLYRLAIWVTTAAVILIIYLYEYHKPELMPSPFDFLGHPLQAALVFLSSFGLAIFRDPILSPISGALLLITIFCLFISSKISSSSKIFLDEDIKWFSLLLFSVMTSTEIVITRTSLGLDNAIDIRYYWEAILGVIGLYFILLNRIKESSKLCSQVETRNNCDARIKNRNGQTSYNSCLNYILFGALIALMLLGTTWQSIEGIDLGENTKQAKMDMAYYLLTYNIQSDEALQTMYPVAQRVRDMAPFLKKYNLSVFSEERPDPNRLNEINGGTSYSIDAINSHILSKDLNISENNIEITGWAIDARSEMPAGAVFIAIGDEIIIPSIYGAERGDVANFLQNENYKYTGFKATFASRILKRGSNEITILVISNDESGYYKMKFRGKFVVTESQIYYSSLDN